MAQHAVDVLPAQRPQAAAAANARSKCEYISGGAAKRMAVAQHRCGAAKRIAVARLRSTLAMPTDHCKANEAPGERTSHARRAPSGG